MCGCKSGRTPEGGPFATGRELVEFVLTAHGGIIAVSPVPNGGLPAVCQECGASFLLGTFVQVCPKCGGIHAVSPPLADGDVILLLVQTIKTLRHRLPDYFGLNSLDVVTIMATSNWISAGSIFAWCSSAPHFVPPTLPSRYYSIAGSRVFAVMG